MNLNRKTIQFTVIENDTTQPMETYVGQYPNLMFLLRDRLYLDSFGECQGMGRCATCLIKTKRITGHTLLKERNEPSTLIKMGFTDPSIRLSCQLMISSDLDGSEIEIFE